MDLEEYIANFYEMGIEALYPKPKTTTANKEHYKL
jgi:hypothetical protein